MNGLPHPNIESAPGKKFDDRALATLVSEIQANFDALTAKFPLSGGDLGAAVRAADGSRKIDCGIVVLTWEGSTLSAPVVVPHQLKVPPEGVVATVILAPEAGKVPIPNCWEFTGSDFTINAETRNPNTGSMNLFWIAVSP
jgi:hypothetical protein